MMDSTTTIIITLAVVVNSSAYAGYNPNEAYDVENFWSKQNISSNVIPISTGNSVLSVTVAFFIKSVLNVNPAAQTTSVVGTLVLSWTDFQLKWNTSAFKTNRALIPVKQIWTPSFQLISGVNRDLSTKLDPRFDSVIVNNEVSDIPSFYFNSFYSKSFL